MYKHCGLEVPANATVLKKEVDCETLKLNAGRQVDIENMNDINWNNPIKSQPDSQLVDKRLKQMKQTSKKEINENLKHTIYEEKSPYLPKQVALPFVVKV
ncbi:hypothetical protein PV325_013993 [Microctonus aethiopoides]|nr:hypothetical protein PV325_013993 [Microctonus aethiopoides]